MISSNERLKVGDTLLLIGPWKDIEQISSDRRISSSSICPSKSIKKCFRAGQGPACAGLPRCSSVGLMVSGIVPNVQAALIGCLLMGALGCVDLNSAYRSIDWKTIVFIVGMLPFSIALERTGGVDLAADGLRP